MMSPIAENNPPPSFEFGVCVERYVHGESLQVSVPTPKEEEGGGGSFEIMPFKTTRACMIVSLTIHTDHLLHHTLHV